MFSWEEFQSTLCGKPDVDIDLLQRCTEYEDGVDASSPHIAYFWQALRDMTSEERTKFLRFVWARSRLPATPSDFPMLFKIQRCFSDAREAPDLYLPRSQTCFFSISLPHYSSKSVMSEKLLYAINNSPNMDADMRLNHAQGWEDIS